MTCAACGAADALGMVSLTPNIHWSICTLCAVDWEAHARAALVNRNRHGAVLAAFRRWCAARKAKMSVDAFSMAVAAICARYNIGADWFPWTLEKNRARWTNARPAP